MVFSITLLISFNTNLLFSELETFCLYNRMLKQPGLTLTVVCRHEYINVVAESQSSFNASHKVDKSIDEEQMAEVEGRS